MFLAMQEFVFLFPTNIGQFHLMSGIYMLLCHSGDPAWQSIGSRGVR